MRKEYLLPFILIISLIILLFYRSEIFQANPLLKKPAPTPTQTATAPTLENTIWEWVETKQADGSTTTPTEAHLFRMTLQSGRIESTTDCNILTGAYMIDEEVLSFGPLASTKKYCGGSIETHYASLFPLVVSYYIEGNNLHLILIRDHGIMKFRSID